MQKCRVNVLDTNCLLSRMVRDQFAFLMERLVTSSVESSNLMCFARRE